MESITLFFIIIFICGIVWNTVSSILMAYELQRDHGGGKSLELRSLPWAYARPYQAHTTQASGTPGSLYYHFLVSGLTTLVSGVVAILLMAG